MIDGCNGIFSFTLKVYIISNNQCSHGFASGQDCFPAEVVLVLDDSESIRKFDPVTDSFTVAVDYNAVVRHILSNLDLKTIRVSLVTYRYYISSYYYMSNQ